MIDTRYVVGNVIEIDGLTVKVLMCENTNLLSYFYDGKTYKGVTINSFVGIIRGPYKIVAKVQKEYLEDLDRDPRQHSYAIDRFRRIVELQLIGWFYSEDFTFGIKCFPMIYNEVVLLTDLEIAKIFQVDINIETSLPVGQIIQTETAFSVPWKKLFNTHIGLFGNTGSGKSNTLCKLYGELFRLQNLELENRKHFDFGNHSQFLILDFNGEYVNKQTLAESKTVKSLSTRKEDGADKIHLDDKEFWNIETLSILFSATEKTQRPFLQNLLDYFECANGFDVDGFINKIAGAFKNVFEGNNDKEMFRLLRDIYVMLGFREIGGHYESVDGSPIPWSNAIWHSTSGTYIIPKGKNPNDDLYLNSIEEGGVESKKEELKEIVQANPCREHIENFSLTDRLRIMAICQLIYGLRCRHVQFDHINPLLRRIDARSRFIDKIIATDKADSDDSSFVSVISLRDCNVDAKKMIPLLIAKQAYNQHRDKNVGEKIESTFHLIIDEAHNILSEQAQREEESWKDYRLDVFEEMIKEGRKFGFYLTIASQRPHDISPTIISQVHNFFLHRLVNDRDLQMINNTINSLDRVSRHFIPTLAPGQCVVTGTAFELPVLVQIEQLSVEERPASDDADLERIWLLEGNPEENNSQEKPSIFQEYF